MFFGSSRKGCFRFFGTKKQSISLSRQKAKAYSLLLLSLFGSLSSRESNGREPKRESQYFVLWRERPIGSIKRETGRGRMFFCSKKAKAFLSGRTKKRKHPRFYSKKAIGRSKDLPTAFFVLPRSSSSISFYEGVKRKKQRDALLFCGRETRRERLFFGGSLKRERDV